MHAPAHSPERASFASVCPLLIPRVTKDSPACQIDGILGACAFTPRKSRVFILHVHFCGCTAASRAAGEHWDPTRGQTTPLPRERERKREREREGVRSEDVGV